jgi:penicillin-binding protein 2
MLNPVRLIPSMFHRRLLLLLVLVVVPFGLIAARMVRLTLDRGDEMLARAESKLVHWTWAPTVRGSILDRKERVLAQDRPSYDVAVDYSVISGQWAYKQAAAVAKKIPAKEWRKLAPEQRQERIERYRPAFDEHVDRAWALIASTAGINRSDLAQRLKDIQDAVEQRRESVVDRQRVKQIDAKLGEGAELTSEVQEEIEKRVNQDTSEQRAPHVVAARVSDEVGFAFLRLADQTARVDPTADGRLSREVPLVPGLSVTSAGDREYLYDTIPVELDQSTLPTPIRRDGKFQINVQGVATQILGWMRTRIYGTDPKHPDQLGDADQRTRYLAEHSDAAARAFVDDAELAGGQRLDRGLYQEGDGVGAAGLEASCEPTLRGLRGLVSEKLDTGEERHLAAEPGRDVKLTLDIMLQARIQAIMSPAFGLAEVHEWHGADRGTMPVGTPLNGAAVVLDIDTGDILAMVSTPTFSRQTLRDHPEDVFKDELNKPFLNRCVSSAYPPGSVAKALILTGAVTRGQHHLDQTIECTGHLFPDRPNQFRCWIFKQHQRTHTAELEHELSAPEALMVSCNIYFFTLGRRLAQDGIVDVYHRFGVGQRWNLGVGPEFPGQVGRLGGDGSDLSISDAIQMGIGQGPVAWTPLHAANAYATLARHGMWIQPRISMDAPMQTRDLHLDQAAVDAALEGLRLVVNDPVHGSGHAIRYEAGAQKERIFNVPGVEVRGKTGTATAPTIRVKPGDPLYAQAMEPPRDTGEEGEERFAAGVRILRKGDHSWFVVLVGRTGQGPRFAISVIMEYAGSGAKVSGPIANQIIRALVDEGYL